MTRSKSWRTPGFAALEAVLVIVVIAGIVAAGLYVFNKKHQVASTSNAANTASSQPATPPINGTSASVSQLAQQAANTEASVDTSNDAQAQQSITAANSAAGNVGGAYNENNL